jgi:hypothetical protein
MRVLAAKASIRQLRHSRVGGNPAKRRCWCQARHVFIHLNWIPACAGMTVVV